MTGRVHPHRAHPAGDRAAATLARSLVVAPHREGEQAQYIERPLPDESVGGPVSEVMEWALENLDQSLTVTALADRARILLETTTRTVADIARNCGFASPMTFRQNFVTAFSTTPTSYRRRFARELSGR